MANKGDVTYELRADDSKLESDISEANKKVEKATEKTAKKSESTEKQSAKVKKSVKEDVTRQHEQENKKQEESDEDSHRKREESARSHGETLKSIASGTAKAIGAGMLATGTAVAGVGALSVNSANDLESATNSFFASTGRATEQTVILADGTKEVINYSDRYKKIMEDIYKNNYGESFEDISNAMAAVKTNMMALDDTSLQNVTESAFALRDTFEYEIAESTRAANTMMEQFGISGEEAMNMIAAGAQSGLDYSGEFLDSINEYSVQFAKMGMGAEDMFKIFESGAASGAFNLDKIGDAVKEMAIRVIDGSDTTKQGFELIGMNADEMASKFAAGGETAKTAFYETIDALAAMEDPIAQNAAGVDLFGTMWEDLGPEAVTALSDIQDGVYQTSDAMKQIKDVKYDDLGSMFEGLKRSAEILLIPLGEELIPLLSELIDGILPLLEQALPPVVDAVSDIIEAVMPAIEEILPALMESLSELGEPLMEIANEVFPVLLDAFSELLPLISEIARDIFPVFADLLDVLLPPLMEIIDTLLPPLIQLVSALLPIFDSVIDVLNPILELFTSLLKPIADLVTNAFIPLINIITPLIQLIADLLIPEIQVLSGVFSSVFSGIVTTVTKHIGNITNIFRNIIDFIKNVFTGNWKAAWQNVKDIFKNIVEGLGNIFKAPLNFIIDGINGFLGGLNKIKIPDWVPGVGGKGFNIPKIPRLKVGMDYVPSDFFPAFLDEGEWVLTKEEANLLRSLGGLEGMVAMSGSLRSDSVNVNVQGGTSIDYVRLGNSVADALIRSEVAFKCDERVFGRLVKDVK